MRRTMRSLIVLAALVSAGAVDASGQMGPERLRGPRGELAAEEIMRMRDRLELDEDQVARLDAIRREEVEGRNAARAELDELRSQLRAGQIERGDLMARMEELRSGNRERADARRERIESLLSEDQLRGLEELRARRPGVERGRARMRPGSRPGMRGGRPGFRGPRAGARGGRGAARRGRPAAPRLRFDRGGPGFDGPGFHGRRGPRWHRRGFRRDLEGSPRPESAPADPGPVGLAPAARVLASSAT